MKKLDADEAAIVQIYEQCENCREIAEKYGCCDETIRRILKRHGIPLTHRHPKPQPRSRASMIPTAEELQQIVDEYYQTDITVGELAKKYHRAQYIISAAIKKTGRGYKTYWNTPKISDEELIDCVGKGMSCSQIAAQYSMSAERVWRRAKRLNLDPRDEYRGGHWRRRARLYGCEEFDSSITLEEVIERDHGICQICGLYVDKTDIEHGHIKRMYPTVDHIIPLSKGGTHTWDNVQLAHMMCNAGKCDKANPR